MDLYLSSIVKNFSKSNAFRIKIRSIIHILSFVEQSGIVDQLL